MQPIRMLISTATILAATAVAWQVGPTAGAQEPGPSKPPGGEPGATREVRIILDKSATVTGDVKVIEADEPAKPQAPAGGTREIRKEVRVIRGQEAGAAKNTEEALKAQVKGRIEGLRLRHADDVEDLNRVLRFREGGPNDPHRDILLKLKAVAHESCVQCHAGGVSVRLDDMLGLTLVPADETLRSQLKLDGKGLVVTAVAHGSSGESGGVKEKDILIECEGKRLGSIDDLRDALKAIGAGPRPEVVAEMPKTIRRERIALKLVRAGEMKEVAVPPPFPPTVVVGRLAHAGEAAARAAPSYWIGVSIDEVDDTLREHLKLGEKVGLVVSDVLKDSPAAKVGLEKNDILLQADGKPLKAPDDLVKSVQATKGTATIHLRIRHAGDGAGGRRPSREAERPLARCGGGRPLVGIQGDHDRRWLTGVGRADRAVPRRPEGEHALGHPGGRRSGLRPEGLPCPSRHVPPGLYGVLIPPSTSGRPAEGGGGHEEGGRGGPHRAN